MWDLGECSKRIISAVRRTRWAERISDDRMGERLVGGLRVGFNICRGCVAKLDTQGRAQNV